MARKSKWEKGQEWAASLDKRLPDESPAYQGELLAIIQNRRALNATWYNQQVASVIARDMPDVNKEMFQAWAREHPTVDPKMYAPLASYGVGPNNGLAEADIATQVANGTYTRTAGQRLNVTGLDPSLTNPAPVTDPNDPNSGLPAAEPGFAAEGASPFTFSPPGMPGDPVTGTPEEPRVLGLAAWQPEGMAADAQETALRGSQESTVGPLNTAPKGPEPDFWEMGVNNPFTATGEIGPGPYVKGAVRGTVAGLDTISHLPVAITRESIGMRAKQKDIIQKYGLSETEASAAFGSAYLPQVPEVFKTVTAVSPQRYSLNPLTQQGNPAEALAEGVGNIAGRVGRFIKGAVTRDDGTRDDLVEKAASDWSGTDYATPKKRTALVLGTTVVGAVAMGGGEMGSGWFAGTEGTDLKEFQDYVARKSYTLPVSERELSSMTRRSIDSTARQMTAQQVAIDVGLTPIEQAMAFGNDEDFAAALTGNTDMMTNLRQDKIESAQKALDDGSYQGLLDKNRNSIDERVVRDKIAAGYKGTPWTFGRGVASDIYDQDTTAFQLLSGLIDAGSNVAFDPSSYIVGAKGTSLLRQGLEVVPGSTSRALSQTGKVRAGGAAKPAIVQVESFGARRVIGAARDSSKGAAAANEAISRGGTLVTDPDLLARGWAQMDDGRVIGPHGVFVTTDRAWNFLTNSRKGQRIVDEVTNITSPHELYLRTNGKLDPDVVKALAGTKTTAETRAVLATNLGVSIDSATQLGSLGRSTMLPVIMRNGSLRNFPGAKGLRVAPRGTMVSTDNPDDVIREMNNFLLGAGATPEEAIPYMDRVWASLDDHSAMYQTLYGKGDSVFGGLVANKLIERGVAQSDARELTRAYTGAMNDSAREYWNKSIAAGTPGGPLLESEFLGSILTLPDYREIRRAGDTVNTLRRKLTDSGTATSDIDDLVRDGINGFTTAWKSSVLVRPAFIFREVGEMSFAASQAGYTAALSDPAGLLSMAFAAAVQKEASTVIGRLASTALTGTKPTRRMAEIDMKVSSGNRASQAMGVVQKGVYNVIGTPSSLVNKARRIADDDESTMRGIAGLMPWLDLRMADVNGSVFWDDLVGYANGTTTPEKLEPHLRQLGMVHGNFYLDESSLASMGKRMIAVRYWDETVAAPHAQARPYLRAMANLLGKTSDDRLARIIADPTMTHQDAIDFFMAERLRPTKAQLPQRFQSPNVLDDVESFIDDVSRHIDEITANDPVLKQMIVDRKFNGVGLNESNTDLIPQLKQMLDANPTAFPATLETSMMDRGLRNAGGIMEFTNKHVTGPFFQGTAEFADIFQRAPLLREAYVRRVARLGELISPAAKQEILANLRDAGDKELFKAVKGINARGTLTVDEVHATAAGFAAKESQRVFYDAMNRQNYSFALRVVMPFVQASMNTFKRWGMLSAQNPQNLYRTLKPLYFGEMQGSGVLYDAIGHITGDEGMKALWDAENPDAGTASTGFFYNDPYGDRQFAYPLIGALVGLLPAVQTPLVQTANAGGLSVAGQSLWPGGGPMLTLGGSLFAQTQLEEEGFRGQVFREIFPYGVPDGTFEEKVFGSFANTWMQRAASTGDRREMANATMGVIPALMGTGNYGQPGNMTPAQQERLIADASAQATSMGFIGALMSAVAPSSSSSKALVESVGSRNAGRLYLLSALQQEYQNYVESAQGDPDRLNKQITQFYIDFGPMALQAIVPKVVPGSPAASQGVWEFRTDNPEAYKANKDVLNYFFAADGELSLPLLKAQRREGSRVNITPAQWVEAGQSEMGWMLWNAAQAQLDQQGVDKDERVRANTAIAKNIILKTNGAWQRTPASPDKIESDIIKIKAALEDPAIQSLSTSPALRAYLDSRDDALAQLRDNSDTPSQKLSDKDAGDVAAQLWGIGQRLAQQDTSGGFRTSWERLFKGEFGPDFQPSTGTPEDTNQFQVEEN